MKFIVKKLYQFFLLVFYSDLILTPKEFQGSVWKRILFILNYPNSLLERREFIQADFRTVIPEDIRREIMSGDTLSFVDAASLFMKGLEENRFPPASTSNCLMAINLAEYELSLLCDSSFHGNNQVSNFCKACISKPKDVSSQDALRLADLLDCIFDIRFSRFRAGLSQILATGVGIILGNVAGKIELDSGLEGMLIVGIIGFLTGTALSSPNARKIIALPAFGCLNFILSLLLIMVLGFTGKTFLFVAGIFSLVTMVLLARITKWNEWMRLKLEEAFNKTLPKRK